jgi:hypothetical protein
VGTRSSTSRPWGTASGLIADELKLGPVLRWPITSRSTLREGLYRYDPIGRLRDEHIRQLRQEADEAAQMEAEPDNIGRHIVPFLSHWRLHDCP